MAAMNAMHAPCPPKIPLLCSYSVLTFMAGACPGRHIAHAILENNSILAATRHLLSVCSQAAPCMLAFLAAAHFLAQGFVALVMRIGRWTP